MVAIRRCAAVQSDNHNNRLCACIAVFAVPGVRSVPLHVRRKCFLFFAPSSALILGLRTASDYPPCVRKRFFIHKNPPPAQWRRRPPAPPMQPHRHPPGRSTNTQASCELGMAPGNTRACVRDVGCVGRSRGESRVVAVVAAAATVAPSLTAAGGGDGGAPPPHSRPAEVAAWRRPRRMPHPRPRRRQRSARRPRLTTMTTMTNDDDKRRRR